MLSDVLFIDIETASSAAAFADMDNRAQQLWMNKMARLLREVEPDQVHEVAGQLYDQKAAIYAEFGQIVCICCGLIVRKEDGYHFKMAHYADKDERVLLDRFFEMLSRYFIDREAFLCGHNLKEFDIPYICRRAKILGLSLPLPLRIQGRKPWEIDYLLDTMQMWRFGDYKAYTSLDLLAYSLGIDSPKHGLHGAEVSRTFWEGDQIERIVEYCKKDIFTTAQIYLKLTDQDIDLGFETI